MSWASGKTSTYTCLDSYISKRNTLSEVLYTHPISQSLTISIGKYGKNILFPKDHDMTLHQTNSAIQQRKTMNHLMVILYDP